MGFEKVREDVLARARKEAQGILSEAKKEEEQVIAVATQKADEIAKALLDDAELRLAEERSRDLAAAELEAAKALLDARKRLIEEVYFEAAAAIVKSPAARRSEHVKSLLRRAREQMDVQLVMCNERDVKSVTGVRCQPAGIAGGIIAENSDGTVRIDLSYGAMIEKVRELTLKDVAKILFTGN
ncbi:hypothetical protein HYY74_07720 [Candidatus Woesearchaeota archaeon]|nr:hypothetical protein [Candidatus Woesearchaeota archaeon]